MHTYHAVSLLRLLILGASVIVTLAAWVAAFVAHHHGTIGTVLLVGIGGALVAILMAVHWKVARWVQSVQDAGPDALASWRDHRVVSDLSLHANGERDVTLRLVLARELGSQEPVILEFRAVSGLRLRQFWGEPVSFSRLRCREVSARADRRLRYQVWDEHNETIWFRCGAIEPVANGDLGV